MREHLDAIDTIVRQAGLDGLALQPSVDVPELGFLDADLRSPVAALLAAANGQGDAFADLGLDWLPPHGRLFSAAEIAEVWQAQRRWDEDLDPDDIWTQDAERVQSVIGHPRRVQLWGDPQNPPEGGAWLDGIPGPAGRVGQIIASVSECEFEVVAWSLPGLFARYAEALGAGQLVVAQWAYGWRVEPAEKLHEFDPLLRVLREGLVE